MQSQSPRNTGNLARTRPPSLRSTGVGAGLFLALMAFIGLGIYVFNLEDPEGFGVDDQGQTTTTDPAEQAVEETTTTAAPSTTTTGIAATAETSAGAGQQLLTVGLADPLALTPATATVELMLDPGSGEICYSISIEGMESPYDGHIHVGPAGVKGGIVVDLGALSGDAPTGCLPNAPIDTQAILNDLGGHYVEFHDPDGTRTVRAQLAMVDPAAPAETNENGALIVIEAEQIRLVGDVPDQVTIDKLVESFADIDLEATPLDTSGLVITPGAPRPSGRIFVDDAVLFAVDSDQLPDTELPVLDTLATIFRARPAWQLTVVGHTDGTGSAVYNLELSLRRAGAVRAALESRGVPTDSLKVEGAGSTAPIASNETPEGRASNRRIEFEIRAG